MSAAIKLCERERIMAVPYSFSVSF